MKPFYFGLLVCTLSLYSCQQSTESKVTEQQKTFAFEVTNLTDEQYPDNPDIGFRAKYYKNQLFNRGELTANDLENNMVFSLRFYLEENDSIVFKNIDLTEYIPTIPEAIKKDEYLSYLSCVNQEWNRNQVKFTANEFSSSDHDIVRVDVARNCLNAYLWEIIVYTQEDGQTLPYGHGWFEIPHDLYAALFEKKNNIDFGKYKASLEEWVAIQSKSIDPKLLRTAIAGLKIKYEDKSNEMYPMSGARKKKFKEIIYPKSFDQMKDLQNDSTVFATFSPPGFYNKKDPRTTELGRFYYLDSVSIMEIKSKINGDTLHEIRLQFKHRTNSKLTSLVIGGLNFSDFPVLKVEDANNGWKNSMGISNHTFYENQKQHNTIKASHNPYYAFLTDQNNQWLDSHKLGIDGPIFHFSDEQRSTLHLWLLSFERHALVGHYAIYIDQQ